MLPQIRALPATALFLALAPAALAAEPKPFAAGNVLIGLTDQHQIREFTPDGTLVRSIGDGVFTGEAEDVVVGPDGRIYLSQYSPGRVFVFESDGAFVDTWGAGTSLGSARGMALGPRGTLYVSSYSNDRILEFILPTGDVMREIGVNSGLDGPVPLAVGPNGNLYAGSNNQKKIYELDPCGVVLRTLGDASLPHCAGMAFGQDGQIYVSSYETSSIMRFDHKGAKTGEFSAGSSGGGDLSFGLEGNIYVLDGFGLNLFTAGGLAVQSSGGFFTPGHIGGMAIVPAFFEATLTGTLERDGQPAIKIKQPLRVGVRPGSNQVTLFADQYLEVQVLTPFLAAFPHLGIVFTGTEAVASEDAKKRTFQGQFRDLAASGAAHGSLRLVTTGKFLPGGQYLPTKGSAEVTLGDATKLFRGKLALKKRLN